MKKYKVVVYFTALSVEIVDAENENEALQKACGNFDCSPYDLYDVSFDSSYIISQKDIKDDLR